MAQDEKKIRTQLRQIEMALLTASDAEVVTLELMRENLLRQLAELTPAAA